MIYIKIKIKDITVKGIKRIDKDISEMEKFKDKILEIKDIVTKYTQKNEKIRSRKSSKKYNDII